MADWPQDGCNPQRTASQPAETFGSTWSIAWRYQFYTLQKEKLFPKIGAIVSAGHVLIPTLMGTLRSFTAGATGPLLEWTTTIGAPVMGTGCADGVNYYVADVYGRLSAWKLANGQSATGWSNPVQVTNGLPFQASLLLADGKLIIGGADGTLYARDPANGAAVWSRPLGAAICQGAAWSNTTGTGLVVVGTMDGKVAAVNSANGALVWQTSTLPWAAAFKDYWPVIVGSKVYIRPWAQIGIVGSGLTTPTRAITVSDISSSSQQDTALANYVASPSSYARALYVLDLATGADTPSNQVIHWSFAGVMTGSPPPVAVDRDGMLIIPVARPPGYSGGAYGWGRLDPATRKVTDLLAAGTAFPTQGNEDESILISTCAIGVLAMHIQEQNAATTGFYRQDTNVWQVFGAGAGTSLLYVNTQGGGANAGAISGGLEYHLCHPHVLVARKAS